VVYKRQAPMGGLLRPLLLVRSALAVGGTLAPVLPAAVGLEYVHMGSLGHRTGAPGSDPGRRDVPGAPDPRTAVYDRLGSATAVVMGSTPLYAWFEALSECAARGVREDRIAAVCRVQAEAGRAVRAGATRERATAGRLDIEAEHWLETARLTTAVPFAAACRVGATLAGAPPEWTDALAVYGEQLGMALRLQEELRPYVPERTRRGRRAHRGAAYEPLPTLPLLLAFDRADVRQHDALCRAFAVPAGAGAFRLIRSLVIETGGHRVAAGFVQRYAIRAAGALTALPDTSHRRRLEALVPTPVTGPLR
uniref:polyprenyl synthetase family protein n=1 Tax=Streptomyces clavuligerus TaxID=1901 RepID=UPI0018D0B214